MKNNDKVDKIFSDEEILEREEITLDDVEVESKGTVLDISEDYNFVRKKIIQSIVRGSELIDEAVREAKTDPTPRAVESAAGAVKTLTDVSNSLIKLHEKIREIAQTTEEGAQTTEEGVQLHTTLSELLKQIEIEEETE